MLISHYLYKDEGAFLLSSCWKDWLSEKKLTIHLWLIPSAIYILSPSHTHLMEMDGLPYPLQCLLTGHSKIPSPCTRATARQAFWPATLLPMESEETLLSQKRGVLRHSESFFHFSIYLTKISWTPTMRKALMFINNTILLLLSRFCKCQKINTEQDPLGPTLLKLTFYLGR